MTTASARLGRGRFLSGLTLSCGSSCDSSRMWQAAPPDAGISASPRDWLCFRPTETVDPDSTFEGYEVCVDSKLALCGAFCGSVATSAGTSGFSRAIGSLLLPATQPPKLTPYSLSTSPPPSATLPAAPAGQTLSSIRVNGTRIRQLSGPPDPWAKLIVRIHRRCRAPNWVQHLPSGKSSTCYEMLRFPVFLKVWRDIL